MRILLGLAPPFEWIIVRGIAFRHRPAEVAEHVDRVLLARADLLHHRVDRRVAEEELELVAVACAVDVPGAEALAAFTSMGKSISAGRSAGATSAGRTLSRAVNGH